jgi:hypothetical protein
MNRRPLLALGLSLSILAATPAVTATPAPGEWPTRWQVNGNGATGVLELSIRGDGSLIGRLLDEPIEGYVSGRHLFIRRTVGERAEIWEGWLGKPRSDDPPAGSNLIVAGTISVDEAGRTLVYPWFGTPEPPAARVSVAETPPASSPPAPIAVPDTASMASPPSGGPLSGTWTSVGGEQFEIVQDGKRLTVTRSDGSLHAGRMTGASSFVVGLRKGCCNGEFDGPDVIVWNDGVRWRRAD